MFFFKILLPQNKIFLWGVCGVVVIVCCGFKTTKKYTDRKILSLFQIPVRISTLSEWLLFLDRAVDSGYQKTIYIVCTIYLHIYLYLLRSRLPPIGETYRRSAGNLKLKYYLEMIVVFIIIA